MKQVVELLKRQQWTEAEERLRTMSAEKPFDPIVLYNLSYVLDQLHRDDEALMMLRQCIHVSPDYLPALINLATLLERRGDLRQAIRYAQMAVKLAPRDAERHRHLALLWHGIRNLDYALETNDRALALRPQAVEWRFLRMSLLTSMKRTDAALIEARRMIAIPKYKDHLDTLLTIDGILRSRSDWKGVRALNPSICRAMELPEAKNNPSRLMMSFDDPNVLHHLAMRDADSPSVRPPPSNPNPKTPCESRQRIILGYLTADVREHPVAQMLFEIVSRHDRTRFELVLLRLAPVDTSAIGKKVLAHFDRDLDLVQDSDLHAAEKIRALGVDILIDLMGATAGSRSAILAARPCRAQVLWLGCAVSTGTTFYDAFLVDTVVAPHGYEQFCTEPLVRLPCCYHPISQGLHETTSIATRHTLGIPVDAVVVGLIQQPNRILPEFIEKVVRILARYPEVHLMLRITVDSRPMVRSCLAEWDIDPDRVLFIQRIEERSDYLRLIELFDLVIDSHPYGGHSTTGEALSLGTPVLACAGRSIHSRVAASMMHDMGLSDLVTTDVEDQMATLDQLLAKPTKLIEWKKRFAIAASQSRGLRHTRLTRALEDAYIATYQKKSFGEVMEIISVANSTSDTVPDA